MALAVRSSPTYNRIYKRTLRANMPIPIRIPPPQIKCRTLACPFWAFSFYYLFIAACICRPIKRRPFVRKHVSSGHIPKN